MNCRQNLRDMKYGGASIGCWRSLCVQIAAKNMEKEFQECLWKNFAGAIDMLSGIIELCPDEIWKKDSRFFYLSYHTVIFLDFYLSRPVKDFKPLLPYTLADPEQLPDGAVDDVIPNEYYSRQDILYYLNVIRKKCKKLVLDSTKVQFAQNWIAEDEIDLHGLCPSLVKTYTVLEIIFYNFRHVQHHVGQLNYLLRHKADRAVSWFSQAD